MFSVSFINEIKHTVNFGIIQISSLNILPFIFADNMALKVLVNVVY
jgi:hypothetical protein